VGEEDEVTPQISSLAGGRNEGMSLSFLLEQVRGRGQVRWKLQKVALGSNCVDRVAF
jgi:hypothetical protein